MALPGFSTSNFLAAVGLHMWCNRATVSRRFRTPFSQASQQILQSRSSLPYLGDYDYLLAVGNEFRGVF